MFPHLVGICFLHNCDFCTLMHESVNTLVGHMCPTCAGNMFPTYCKSNAKLSKSDAYTAHLTTSLLFSCLISFGRCFYRASSIGMVFLLHLTMQLA